jgi:hypothetical protein
MAVIRLLSTAAVVLIACLVVSRAVTTNAQPATLGMVYFPTSGSEQAHAHFLRGVAALHSFWYEEALVEFRTATRVEPGFLMGYWGEALAHNHPLWGEQDTEAARKALNNITDTAKLTARERAYISAVKVLYGEGEKRGRDEAYAAAMEQLYREYPDDQEAACLYALSLLGTVRPGDHGFRRQMQAGAIALEVYHKNPQHPGAAHYIIHAFDDPEHAILALPAARRYANIAPAAHHARHMPSHIFLQLGMWREASVANASAWEASEAWVQRKHLPLSKRDYHSLHWLLYSELQQGRYRAAEDLLALMRKALTDASGEEKLRPGYTAYTYAAMAAAFVVETERWELATTLLEPLRARSELQTHGTGATEHAGPGASQPTATATAAPAPSTDWTQILSLHIRGLAAAAQGSAEAQQRLAELRALGQRQSVEPERTRGLLEGWEVRTLEIAAVAGAVKGDLSEALTLMQRATVLEESLSPPSGPPGLVKPAHELYGEMLLRADRPTEAATQFATALLRQPNRARSLLGAARAAARGGDAQGAVLAYAKLLRQWQQSDPQLAELREAQEYLQQASVR